MDKKRDIINKSINSFVVLFCLLIFPVILIYCSLDFIFETNINNLKQDMLSKMNNQLEYLNKYSNNKRYFHFLLLNISQYAQTVDNPLNYIELNINNLRKKYPGKIQFIVWDDNGKVVNEISDRINFNYVLKKLFQSLKEVTDKITQDYSFHISNLDSISKNFNIFRSFFGKIFISENLKKPLSRGFDAGPFLTELGHGLTYAWFSVNKKISFLCFLSDDLLNEYSGLEKISNELNTKDSLLKTGYSINSDYDNLVKDFSEKYSSDLQLALATFEYYGDSIFENDRVLVKMSMPESTVKTFCFLAKTDSIWNYESNKNTCFFILLSILLILYALWGIYYYYKHHFFSIRWKLTILFLFANLAPIAIIGFIAKDYLDNQRLFLKNEIVSDLEKAVREVEARYNSMIDDYSLRLNSTVSEIARTIGNNSISPNEIDKLKSLYDDYNAFELYIIASNSQMVAYKRDETKAKQRLSYMTSFGETVLNYANKDPDKDSGQEIKGNYSRIEKTGFLDAFLNKIGNIYDFNIGEMNRIYYSFTFGDKSINNTNYLFMMFWDREYLQSLFLKETYKTIYKIIPEARFFIKSNVSNNSYGDRSLENIVDSVLHKNSGIVKKIIGDTYLNSKKYIYVCINGNILKDWILVAAYPENRINGSIRFIIIQIIGGIFLSLLLTFIIISILSKHFLKPIHGLEDAAIAIGDRNFNYRITIEDQDEFGHLGQVFNRVIEGLADFEVAKIVQESIFPDTKLVLSNYNIFGKSIVATTLGGDYFDYFKINNNYLGIIIANVSVKGIPAGLIMAMAKSVVLSSSEEIKLDPAKLTIRLNNMYLGIEGKSLSHIMTFQYLVLNVDDGTISFTNAGHCPPILIDHESKNTSLIDFNEPPLGTSISHDYKIFNFNISSQQSIILYTNAVVNAFNKSPDKSNNEEFVSCLKQNFDSEPEQYYNNIYNVIHKSESNKHNDITLVVINRS